MQETNMTAGIGLIGVVVLLGACAVVIAALRKPSWPTLLAAPFGMLLLLLGIGTVTWLRAAPQQVSYLPPAATQMVENWDHLQSPALSDWQSEHDGSVIYNQGRSGAVHLAGLNAVPIGILLFLGVAACVTVLALSRKWIAQHANVVLPVLGIGLAGILAAGVLFGGYFLVDSRMATSDRVVRDRGMQLRTMIANPRHRFTSNASLETVAADVQDADDTPQQADVPAEADAAALDVDSSSSPDSPTEALTNGPTPELPEWARGETVDVDESYEGVHQNPVVLVSDQYATVPDSEVQLEEMSARALQQQLRMQLGSSFAWEPSQDFLHQSGAIQNRFVEPTVLELESGPMPMVRTYWQVGATPHVSSLAQKEWKSAAVEERLTMLGAGAAILTLLFAGGAAGLRFDSATGGRYRRRMAAATAIVGLAATTAALFVA